MEKAVLLCMCLSVVSSYTINGGASLADSLPRQFPNGEDFGTFFRVHPTRGRELFRCPPGHHFDAAAVKCAKGITPGAAVTGMEAQYLACPEHLRGTMPYFQNCRNYVDCWDGMGVLETCTDHLVYNCTERYCDFPEITICCEYSGKDDTQLVNNEF